VLLQASIQKPRTQPTEEQMLSSKRHAFLTHLSLIAI